MEVDFKNPSIPKLLVYKYRVEELPKTYRVEEFVGAVFPEDRTLTPQEKRWMIVPKLVKKDDIDHFNRSQMFGYNMLTLEDTQETRVSFMNKLLEIYKEKLEAYKKNLENTNRLIYNLQHSTDFVNEVEEDETEA